MKKSIPMKNYIILTIIFATSICLTYYLTTTYNLGNKNKSYYISDVIKEIKTDELSNYIIENNGNIILVLYEDDNFNLLDKKLKKYILNTDIESEIVYVMINDDNYSSLIKNINSNIIKQTNLLYIENGVISSVLYDDNSKLHFDDFKKLKEEKRDQL